VATLLALLCVLPGCRDAGIFDADRNRRPNVVLILIDTLRADHVGHLGYERTTTPHLDALAEESWVFERATSAAPWTNPAFAAVFTGREPRTLFSGGAAMKIPESVPRISQLLSAEGYQTAGIISHSFLGEEYDFHLGFDLWDQTNIKGPLGNTSPLITDRALSWLDEPPSQPFLLVLHYFDPHSDYRPRLGFTFGEPYQGTVHSGWGNIHRIQQQAREGLLSAEDIQHLRDVYDSEIGWTDSHIGRLLDGLRDRGLFDDALVVVTADHGEAFMDRPSRWIGHGENLHQELIRVPLIVHLPGQTASERVPGPVGTIDVLPTILDVVGAEAASSPEFAGRSLVGDRPDRPVFSETQRRGHHESITQGRWKLIYTPTKGATALFDLEADPMERRDESGAHPDIADELLAALKSWERRNAPPSAAARLPEVSEAEKERLRALGYAND
jgi:arylsulfatase A-like enzyme